MEGFGFLDIIFFAMVAAFIVLRLRSVVGRRTGHERRSNDRSMFDERQNMADDNVISLPERSSASPSSEDAAENKSDIESDEAIESTSDSKSIAQGLKDIRRADASFDRGEFLVGARVAYEMVVTAFAKGDEESLEPLLATDVFADFSGAIGDRKERRETLETTLVAIESAEIIDADMRAQSAEVTVSFISEFINVTRNSEGEVVAGDPRVVDKVTDIWTFARDTRISDPNWRIILTSSSN